ncbi:MAG: M48 family metallopeptidase, partial [Planctomycetota bacterium]
MSNTREFTRPSSYRFRAWMAMLGLLLFVAVYLALASWFTYTTYRMIAGMTAGGDGAVPSFFTALASGFLAVFMWKALFFMHRGEDDPGIEIKPEDQPQFFTFLYDLADEIGAPRPYRVFISPGVNAAVFYDLSMLNLIFPSKKNLLIGLGLVNVTTRSEFRAVLAHEFGHFAQRTMAVGRWVYIGEQVAGHMIGHRGRLDTLLDWISSIDLRLAWVGWLMRLVVWSIRSLMETVFRVVIIAHRALSREMEFDADLVAVSATGSDALVHALYRLQSADEDWQESISFCVRQLERGRRVTDIFTVHSMIGEHMQRIFGEQAHREPPPLPQASAESHRIFSPQIAAPPQMWRTHPPNTEREENAKRKYIPMRLDNSAAWSVLQNPEQLRLSVTDYIFKDAKLEKPPTDLSDVEIRQLLDEEYASESMNAEYHGIYLGRPITRSAESADKLYLDQSVPSHDLTATLNSLYPASLAMDMLSLRDLNEQVAMLELVESGHFEATSGTAQHRGEEVRQGQVAGLIKDVKSERDVIQKRLDKNDRLSRTAHRAAAQKVSGCWDEYHASLIRMLHYAEHSEANARDAYGQLSNVTHFATATGTVSGGKLQNVLNSANDLHVVLREINRHAESVKPPIDVLRSLEKSSWREVLDDYQLPPPSRENIGDWMGVIDGWAGEMITRLSTLKNLVLNELLRTEKRIKEMYSQQSMAVTAPLPCATPTSYAHRVVGTERPRQTKLDWWSRFTVADGLMPALMRLGVAGAIVGSVLYFGAVIGKAKIVVYNGLDTGVTVAVGNRELQVAPGRHASMTLLGKSDSVETHSNDGRLIEQFDVTTDKGFATYVYNVAGAAPLVEWTASYGSARDLPPRAMGGKRWRTTSAQHIFTQPPRQVETSGSGETRLVLDDYDDFLPHQLVELMNNDGEKANAVRAHVEFDPTESPDYLVHEPMPSKQ